MSNEAPAPNTFSAILASSIMRETIARLPCSSCRQNTHVRVRRAIPDMAQLPPVFVVNAGVRTADELELWMDKRDGSAGSKRFLPSRFTLSKGEGVAVVVESDKPAAGSAEAIEYELRVRLNESASKSGRADDRVLQAMVVQIQAEGDAPHLVSLARGESPRCGSESCADVEISQSRARRRSPALPGTSSTISSCGPSARKRR